MVPPPNKPNPLPSFLFNQTKSPTSSSASSTPTSPKLYQSSPSQWPPSMRSWVDRCFSSCSTNIERDLMEKKLKVHISNSLIRSCGSLSTINWGSEPTLVVKLDTIATKSERTLNNASNTPSLPKVPKKTLNAKEARAKRFTTSSSSLSPSFKTPSPSESLENMKALREENILIDKDSIIGSCQTLEKPYLRLTSAPDPLTVRPLPVLRKALNWLEKMIEGHLEKGTMDEERYHYICDQFKSLRQDLTVQGIKSAFTVKVYEGHAKLAILQGDMGQFNQCQSQLMELYSLFPSDLIRDFKSYRLLYLLGTRNELEMVSFLKEDHELLPHIYQLRRSLVVGNSLEFIMYFRKLDLFSKKILSSLGVVERVRRMALLSLCRSFRPFLPLSVLENYISLSVGDDGDKTIRWLEEVGAVIDPVSNVIDCKESLLRISV